MRLGETPSSRSRNIVERCTSKYNSKRTPQAARRQEHSVDFAPLSRYAHVFRHETFLVWRKKGGNSREHNVNCLKRGDETFLFPHQFSLGVAVWLPATPIKGVAVNVSLSLTPNPSGSAIIDSHGSTHLLDPPAPSVPADPVRHARLTSMSLLRRD